MATNTQSMENGHANRALEVAKRNFSYIRSRFPDLRMIDDTHEVAIASDDAVSLSMTIPVQPGNRYEINLNLQNVDELHFGVMNFWCEWFPCTDPACANAFAEAVIGFLSRDHRLVEHYIGITCVKSQLQALGDGDWKTIATWARPRALLLLLLPRRWKDVMVIVNG